MQIYLKNLKLNELLKLDNQNINIKPYISYITERDKNFLSNEIFNIVNSKNLHLLLLNLESINFENTDQMFFLFFSAKFDSFEHDLEPLSNLIIDSLRFGNTISYESYDSLYIFCIFNDLDFLKFLIFIDDNTHYSSDYELSFNDIDKSDVYYKKQSYSNFKLILNLNIFRIFDTISDKKIIGNYLNYRVSSNSSMSLKEHNEDIVGKYIKNINNLIDFVDANMLDSSICSANFKLNTIIKNDKNIIINKEDSKYTHYLFKAMNENKPPEFALIVTPLSENKIDIFSLDLPVLKKLNFIEDILKSKTFVLQEKYKYLLYFVLSNIKSYSDLNNFTNIKNFIFNIYFNQITEYNNVLKEVLIRNYNFDLIYYILPLINKQMEKDLISYFIYNLSNVDQNKNISILYNLNPKTFRKNLNKITDEKSLFNIALKQNKSYFYQYFEKYSTTSFFQKSCIKDIMIKYAIKQGIDTIMNYFSVDKSIINEKPFKTYIKKNFSDILKKTQNSTLLDFLYTNKIISENEFESILLQNCTVSTNILYDFKEKLKIVKNKQSFLEKISTKHFLELLFYYYSKKDKFKGLEFLTEDYFKSKLNTYKDYLLLNTKLLKFLVNGENNNLLDSIIKNEGSTEIIGNIFEYCDIYNISIDDSIKSNYYYIVNETIDDLL